MREHLREERLDVDPRQLFDGTRVMDHFGIWQLVANRAGEKVTLHVHHDGSMVAHDVAPIGGHAPDHDGPRVVGDFQQGEDFDL